jgi:hypothetical protein
VAGGWSGLSAVFEVDQEPGEHLRLTGSHGVQHAQGPVEKPLRPGILNRLAALGLPQAGNGDL